MNPLIVKETDLDLIRHWPLELRALFDPRADLELARKIESEQEAESDEEEPPF